MLYSYAMLFCYSPHINTNHFSENIILRASIFAISVLYLYTSPYIIICISRDYEKPRSKPPPYRRQTSHKQNETNLIIHALLLVFTESINSTNLYKIPERTYLSYIHQRSCSSIATVLPKKVGFPPLRIPFTYMFLP